jgi:aryl-alcohol dehydrogenase-like predicted oxidoreductase
MTIAMRPLGQSRIQVSEIALGTMMFGRWGNTDVDECHAMVDAALDAGVTLFDSADVYDDGASETILGEALAGRRDRVVLATKVGNPMAGDPRRSGLSRRWITRACDDSLRRLRTDRIDLYQMHRPDPTVHLEETLGVLDELVVAGKVGAIGTSTFSSTVLDDAQDIAADHGWTKPTAEQPPYSLLARGIEADVLGTCARLGVGAIVWAPLNGGWLTGKYQDTSSDDTSSRANRQPEHFDHHDAEMRTRKRSIVRALTTVANDADMTITQLALAFVLDRPAIIGPRTLQQLRDLLDLFDRGASGLTLELRTAVDALVRPGTNINPRDAGV